MSTCLDIANEYGQWPGCSIPDCPNKACLRLKSHKCWPHTVGIPLNWYRGLHTQERENRSSRIEAEWLNKQVHYCTQGAKP